MALNANTYFSNSIQGQPMAGVDINVETVDSAPKYAAGFAVHRADGCKFRYANIGTATNQGNLVGPSTAGQLTYTGAAIIAPASAVVVPQEYPITPGSVGSHYIQITVASIAANKYQGGYIILTGGTGLGQTYRVVGNTATGNPTSTTLYIQLYEALQTAVTVNTGVIIVQSMFTDLAATATTSPQVTGVLMGTTTSTNLWGWVQTHGPSGCAEDATNTITAGQQVIASPVTAGSYASSGKGANTFTGNALNYPNIGYSLTPAGSSSRLGAIFLELE
jgi:hypothetical protein